MGDYTNFQLADSGLSIWLEIKQYFLTLEEWYSDRDLYHLIGYLIEYEVDINGLKDYAKDVTKTIFKRHLNFIFVQFT